MLTAIKNQCLIQSGEINPNQLLLDAIKSLGEVKQNDKEKVKDYSNKVVSQTKSFIQALSKVMKESSDMEIVVLTGSQVITVLEKDLVDGLAAYIIQVRADHEIYSKLQRNLKQQYMLGHKDYKMDINKAMEALNLNHKKKGANVQQKQQNKEREEDVRSFAKDGRSKQQTRFRCFKCGRKSCKGNNQCTHKNKTKSEWAYMKTMGLVDNYSCNSFVQPTTINQDNNNLVASSITDSQLHHNKSRIEQKDNKGNDDLPSLFHFMDTCTLEEKNIFHNNNSLHWMKKVIILDNQSSTSLFSSTELVKNIRKVKNMLRVYTNAGNMGTLVIAEVLAFGKVWFDPRAIVNIIAWVQVRDHPDYRVDYNYDQGNFMLQHIPSKIKITAFIASSTCLLV